MTDPKKPTRSNSSNPIRGLSARQLAKLRVEVEGYELLERIGMGGQATVYRALQKKDNRIVALKILHAGPHASSEARVRLKREVAALRAMRHPNIVHAIAAGRTRTGLDCLVMNFVDGRPLDALWDDPDFASAIDPKLPPPARLRLFKQICETVAVAHRKGITHRDLSPSNILIDNEGQPHILDFGMASTAFDGITSREVTVTGQFIGKLKYASPEQAKGAGSADYEVDIRSDVYALGVMLYQLLTDGAFPYEVVGNVIDVLNNIIHSQPKPPSQIISSPMSVVRDDRCRRNPPLINETIEAIVLKALEKEPNKRYQSAGELAADIDRYLAGQPTSADTWPNRSQSSKKKNRSRRVAVIAASGILVVTLIGVTMNIRTIAMYLGISSVVAPVLSPEALPIPQSAADAAMMYEAEFLPDAWAGDRRLNQLADDLALVEARLAAVNRQLDAIGVKQPSTTSGPMDVDAFTDQLAKTSTDTGRELEFTVIGKEDRASQEQYEADTIARETNEEALLDIRSQLDAQQASLWAQIAYGTFTGRDVDRVFRYQIKPAEPLSEASMIQESVVGSGVRVRRTFDAAFRTAGESIGSDVGEGGAMGLGMLLADVAQQTKESLVEFRSRVVEAKDVESMSDDDREAMSELAALAKDLIDSLDGAADSQARLGNDTGEMPRLRNRGRLQRDLADAVSAAAEFDQGLVELAGDWEIEVNKELKLRPIRNVAAVSNNQKSRIVRSSKKPINHKQISQTTSLVVGSTWSGWAEGQYDGKPTRNYKDGVKIIKKTRNTVVLRASRSVPNSYLLWTFRVKGNELTLVNVVASNDTASTYKVREGGGTVDGDSLIFRYVNDNYRNGKYVSTSSATLTLVKDKDSQPAQAADPLAAWQPGSRWINSTPGEKGFDIWTVVLRDAEEIVIERDSTSGQGSVRVTCSIRGKDIRVTNVQHVNTRRHVSNRGPRGEGTIKPSSLILNYSVISNNGPRWAETLNLSPE